MTDRLTDDEVARLAVFPENYETIPGIRALAVEVLRWRQWFYRAEGGLAGDPIFPWDDDDGTEIVLLEGAWVPQPKEARDDQ